MVLLAGASPCREVSEPFNYNFTIKTLDGSRIHFEEFKERVVFLNLWATWCKPCRVEMPGIQKLYDEFGNDVDFIMLSLNREGDQSRVARYINKSVYTFPVFMPSGYLPEQLKVDYIPTTIVLDKKGNIVMNHQGAMDYNTDSMKDLLRSLIDSGQ